jgi:hypothetical protein
MKFAPFLIIALLALAMPTSEKYPYRIGYIPEEGAIIFNPDFKTCNEGRIIDYYNVNKGGDQAAGFIGGPKAIKKIIQSEYLDLDLKNESGMLTIRFIINCKAEIDRFQIIENDLDFKPKVFDQAVKNQLLEITRQLKNWRSNTINGYQFDSAMYLTYKLKNGKIIDILP